MKAMVFVQELLSVVLNPLILTISLPACAPQIIDFFREFTVHVDSLGYVCSFAVFDFKRHGNIKFGAPSFGERQGTDEAVEGGADGWQDDERLQSKDGKMEKSFLAFKAAHPEWNPTDPTGSLYLDRLREMHQNTNHPGHYQTMSRRGTAATFGAGSALHKSTLAERSELYERALAQSMANANARARRGIAGNLQVNAANSGVGRRPLVQTQGGNGHMQREESGHVDPDLKEIGVEDDRAEDGGIGSELGDSYVDDVKLRGGRVVMGTGQPFDAAARDRIRGLESSKTREEEEEEAEELANGGVLGLLAQIYDRKRPVM
jgi:autophagy-related protein 9